MLPGLILWPVWLLVAVVWPAVQSLHTLKTRSVEARLWLFYWLCFVACYWVLYWLGWLVRLPFYLVSFVFTDLYAETHLAVACYLVLPRTMGIRRLQSHLLGAGAEKIMNFVFGKLLARMPKLPAAKGPFKDRPGTYTVIKPAGVMPTMATAKGVVLSQLKIGDEVDVLEVVPNDEERRVRARIREPEGWVSLLNMDNGTRWAVHKDDTAARATMPETGALPQQAGQIFANAAAAGCNPAALFQAAPGADAPAQEVSPEECWEALALLESQLARADDPSEDAAARQAAGMLKTMLTTLVQTGNPAMLTMAKAMMPDLGKIWTNDSTREYLQGLLAPPTTDSGDASATPATSAGTSSSGASGSSSAGAGGATASSASS